MELTPSRTKEDAVLLYGGCLFAVAALIALRVFDPSSSHFFPACPLYSLTGFYCPGCGSTRAFHHLLHGDFWAAFAMNPLSMLALPFLLYGGASYFSFQIRGRYLPRVFIPGRWIRALGVLIVLFGIARNIPIHPFNLLAPGGLLR